jgi:hypothetical protein
MTDQSAQPTVSSTSCRPGTQHSHDHLPCARQLIAALRTALSATASPIFHAPSKEFVKLRAALTNLGSPRRAASARLDLALTLAGTGQLDEAAGTLLHHVFPLLPRPRTA